MTNDLLALAQDFVDRKYVARADERQKSMGLAYVEAERADLAREMANFARIAATRAPALDREVVATIIEHSIRNARSPEIYGAKNADKLNSSLASVAANKVLALLPAAPVEGGAETKMVYVKRWRTLVRLPSKYADEIVEALRMSPPVEAEPVAWPNGCNETVPAALRFLADHDRPIGGESRFNAIHLFQLADEIESMASRPLYAAPIPSPAADVERLRKALDSIRQYGADTLSGRADGGIDDRQWQREAVREMTRRARTALAAEQKEAGK